MLSVWRAGVVTAGALACVFAATTAAAASPGSPLRPIAPARVAAPAAPVGFTAAEGSQLIKSMRAAWRVSRGQRVTVAVISSGVDGGVSGLRGKVTEGPRFGAGKGMSPVAGTAFSSAVAGTGRNSANPLGTVGLAPDARILSIRVPTKPVTGSWQSDIAKAIGYAVRHGAGVVCITTSDIADSPALASAVQDAVAHRVIIVAMEYRWKSVGNVPQFPSSLPGVLGAGAALVPGLHVPPKGYEVPANQSILVTAPGNPLNVTGPASRPWLIWGPLSSDAWLTATITLLKSKYPDITPAIAERALAVSATGHPRGGYNTRVGFGLINPAGALRAAGSLLRLRRSAAAGAGVFPASARFTAGPPPARIVAVRNPPGLLGGLAAVAGAGLLLLLAAAVAALRWRRRAHPVRGV